ncbi:MAG: hypothetical protein HOV80_05165 [Polyangiaceae bacterium]|nr:hypothetical protein [Polyangiaceae bacterium]
MRARRPLFFVGALAAALAGVAYPREAHAQAIPPAAERDQNWEAVSTVSMLIGVGTVTLMPRIYYNDPEATVGWKARYHVSQLGVAAALTSATILVDGPIKNLAEGTRPDCTPEETEIRADGSNCESYGMPSTHSFAAWSAHGAGLAIWIIDAWVYSERVYVGSLIPNVVVSGVAATLTSIARGVGTEPYEDPAQIGVGVAAGMITGFLVGLPYALLQEPNCGYGNNVICW